MSRRATLVTAGCVAFLAFAMALVPASLLVGRLPQRIAMHGVGGTIWSGSAAQLRFQGRPLGALEWSCRPWRLLMLEWSCRVVLRPPGGEIAGDLAAGLDGRVEARAVQGAVPISTFEGIATPRGWSGVLELDVERLRIVERWPDAAAGTLVVRALQAPGAAGSRLGDFELVIGEGAVGTDALTGRLRDLGGPLHVRGALELGRDGRYLLSGEAAPGPGAGPAIFDTLAFLGPPDGLGRRPFAVEGSL